MFFKNTYKYPVCDILILIYEYIFDDKLYFVCSMM